MQIILECVRKGIHVDHHKFAQAHYEYIVFLSWIW